MIYVKRDASLIPAEVISAAQAAQAELESVPQNERKDFIKKKAPLWRAFAQYLCQMSYGKCWYSESHDAQSFFDVDHFRPKNEAKRSQGEIDHGYEWLAFSWENFRYAATRSNRLSTNEDTEEVEGKGSWFPLLEGSVKASWDNRCELNEKPVLLDPVVSADVDLLEVDANGYIVASRFALGSALLRVERSCEVYGLNLPKLQEARMRLAREVTGMVEVIVDMVAAASVGGVPASLADALPVPRQAQMIKDKTRPQSPYAKTARATLIRLGIPELCASPEEC